jgi:hypothetical protein
MVPEGGPEGMGIKKQRDEFRLRAIKIGKVYIQAHSREFGFVEFVVKHAIPAEGGGKVTSHFLNKGAMLERAMAKRREPNDSLVIVFVASEGLKLGLECTISIKLTSAP